MAEIVASVEIRLWGDTVGAIAERASRRIVFEYADSFRQRELEISPIHLPLAIRGPQTFDELGRRPGFQGLPGVFADALPDSFGNQVIRAYFAARGEPDKALSPVQRLLYVGERAIGALTFHPAERIPTRPAELQSLEIAALVKEARRVIEGEIDITIPEIYRIGSSAGGMRPKAVVFYNPEGGEIRSGFAEPKPGDIPAILKFDGVGDTSQGGTMGPGKHFNRVEAAYAQMARDSGIDAVNVTMLEDGDRAHLIVERFDLESGGRVHQHTLGGLLHVDYNEPGASSYEEYLRTVLRLGMPPAEITEAFRRMVFNVVAVNQDDHVKNLSFQMGRDGRWRLSPAYDITFAQGSGWTARHQMRVADKTTGVLTEDLLKVADTFRIKSARGIIERIEDVVSTWPSRARDFGVPLQVADVIQERLAERSSSLYGNSRRSLR